MILRNASESVYLRLIRSVSGIRGARRATEVLLSQGSSPLESVAHHEVGSILASDFWKMLSSKNEKLPELVGGRQGLVENAALHQATSLRSIIDSASLVFMHAVLDDVIFECLTGTMTVDPRAWDDRLSNRKLSLGNIKDKSFDDLFAQLLEDHRTKVERDSLPTKLECLISILRPTGAKLSHDAYTYSRERLDRIDQTRHDIVHRTGPREIDSIAEDLRYMEATAFNFLAMTATNYDDPELFEKLLGIPSGNQ